MLSGPAALKNIDRTLLSVRNEIVRLDSELATITGRLAAQERRRVKIIQDIAAVRLVEIERGTLNDTLNLADREAARLLETREQALEALNEKLAALNATIEAEEKEREALLEQVNATSQSIVSSEQQVQAQLSADSAYLAQLERSRDAESIAEEAAEKVAAAQSDMSLKAEPYQKDALFSYLWERGYGTTEYAAGFFARFMDGWVARLIDYEPARVNYWNLTEIPKRLQQHADSVARHADETVMELQQLELDALASAGVPALEEALTNLRTELDQQDDQLEASEQNLNDALEQRAAYVAGEDPHILECLNVLSTVLEQQDLRGVHRYVQVTHSPTDDQLLIELQEIQAQTAALKDSLSDVRRLHDNQLKRLRDIEEVRRDFKNSRFDDVRSGFGNESLLTSILAQFVQGVVTGSDVWRVIKRSQRYRNVGSIPDFGSGGLGNIGDVLGGGSLGRQRRGRRSSWHWPKPRRGGGGFNFPRGGGGGSGGGFRTGGGF